MKIIKIDNEEFEITLENFETVKPLLKPMQYKFEYDKHKAYILRDTKIIRSGGDIDRFYKEYGRYRDTEEYAEWSLIRNKQANRLEALVEKIQHNPGGVHTIVKGLEDDIYSAYELKLIPVGAVTMEFNTAQTIAKMLNEGKFSLE